MRRIVVLPLAASLALAALAVRADTPASAQPAPAPSAAAAAANAPSANVAPAAAVATDAARPATAGGLTDVEIKRAFAKFRKQERDGNTMYCRKETPLGSRLGKTVCYTEDQVLANARAERDAGQMQSQQNVCGLGSCSPGGG